ncbi:ATP-binding domain-containing protein, partial [Prevotella aurantiaca]
IIYYTDKQLVRYLLNIPNVKQNGFNAATLLCGSNLACSILTNIVRPSLGFNSPTLSENELLLITQNNGPTRLMNGDLVKVISTGHRKRRAGLTFLYVEVEEMVNKQTFSLLLIEDILYGNKINLTQENQKALFIDFYRRMKEQDIKPKTDAFKKAMQDDPFLNALRAVYGYALTCHKAQGGEWNDVYLDIPRYLSHSPKRSTYQWLYTAMTRASNRLHVADDFFIT